VDILFDSPPLSICDYDGNVGCVGTELEIVAPFQSLDLLSHVGNVAILSVI